MTTKKLLSPLLLVFILLNFMLITATLTLTPWHWPSPTTATNWSAASAMASSVLAPDQTLQALLSPLLQPATAVVYGQILDQHTAWNLNHTQIETYFTLAVVHTLVGQVAEHIQVRVPGGYLPTAAIGMWSSHAATFAKDEAVLLFLAQEETDYTVVHGEKGKFVLDEVYLVNPALALTVTPALVEQVIGRAATERGRSVTLPSTRTALQALAARGHLAVPFTQDSQTQSLTEPTWPTTTIPIKLNINAAGVGDQVDAFRAAILRALRTWSVVADADFTLLDEGATTATSTGYNGLNEILFMHRGANSQLGQAQIWFTQSGVILEADIWLNDDYHFSVSETPAVGETDLESVVLHELGHWVPLNHSTDPQAVMYAVLNESTKRVLQSDDLNRLNAIYPCSAPPCIHEIYLNPTATPLPTPTLVPTAEVTPTLVPTVATPTGMKSITYLPFVIR